MLRKWGLRECSGQGQEHAAGACECSKESLFSIIANRELVSFLRWDVIHGEVKQINK